VEYGNLTPVGAGGYALIILNPNMHIKCQIPGTCTFKGASAFLTTLESNNDIYTFVSAQGLGKVPNKFLVDSSNLLVEGLVFRGASDKTIDQHATVQLRGYGINMKFKSCLWAQTDAAHPPFAGIDMFRTDNYGEKIQGGGSLQSSLLLYDCTFRNNAFKYAVIHVNDWYWWNNLTLPSHKLTMEKTSITGNTIEYFGASGQPYYSAVVTLRAAICNFTNVAIKDNTLQRARAAIVIVNSPTIKSKKMKLGNNSIKVHQGLGCTDVARVKATRTELAGNQNIVFKNKDLGCTEYADRRH
jgi:hypothetical protein